MAGPPVGALEIVNADQLCVNLTHNMKVYININRSIWFKTDDDELSIAVTNAVGLAKKPMFSLNARHLKVSSDDTGCVRGQVMMIANYTSSKVSFNLGRNENEDVIFGCDEIYNYMKPAPTQETRSKMECLLETCRYHHNRFGDSFYFFANDIKIVQYPSGYVVITDEKFKSMITVNLKKNVMIRSDDQIVNSSKKGCYIIRGDDKIEFNEQIPGHPSQQTIVLTSPNL